MEIRKISSAEPKIIDTIVKLHLAVLTDSFLNNFGKQFLKILYSNLLNSPEVICLVCAENEIVEGFALATKDYSIFMPSATSKNKPYLLYLILIGMVVRPVSGIRLLTSLPQLLLKKDKPHAELQFIAVNPNSQGKGLGSALVKKLSKEFRAVNISQFYVGTKTKNFLSNKFYKRIGFILKYSKKYFGDGMNYYISPPNF